MTANLNLLDETIQMRGHNISFYAELTWFYAELTDEGDPSSEPSCRDGSNEGLQHEVLMRNKKNYHEILRARGKTG